MHRVCGEFNIRFPFSALSSFVDFVICLIYRTLSCTTALMSLMKVHKGIYGIIMYISVNIKFIKLLFYVFQDCLLLFLMLQDHWILFFMLQDWYPPPPPPLPPSNKNIDYFSASNSLINVSLDRFNRDILQTEIFYITELLTEVNQEFPANTRSWTWLLA